MNAKIVCLDFDDVVNNYDGWTGEGFAVINGSPMTGAKENIKALRGLGYIVMVHSVRCGYSGGMVAIVEWLNQHNM